MTPIPTFTDEQLSKVTMPVLAIIGGKDVYFDAERMRRRLEKCMPRVQILYLPEAAHGLEDPTLPALEFLRGESAVDA